MCSKNAKSEHFTIELFGVHMKLQSLDENLRNDPDFFTLKMEK